MKQYYDLPSFDRIYLEDSYVLDCNENNSQLIFKMLPVLTLKNIYYHPPLPEEYYCYKREQIVFRDATKIIWLEKEFKTYTDGTGEIDYGNIDTFVLTDDGLYSLSGDWGRVDVESAPPIILYD